MDSTNQAPVPFRQSRKDNARAGDRKVSEAGATDGKIRILVVEDDPDISAMLEYTLSNPDRRVSTVSDSPVMNHRA